MIDYNRHIKAYRMILSEKFWSDLKISEAFLMGLEVSFSGEFCDSESRIFCPRISESWICLFILIPLGL